MFSRKIEQLEQEAATLRAKATLQSGQLFEVNSIATAVLSHISDWGEDDGATLVRAALKSIVRAST